MNFDFTLLNEFISFSTFFYFSCFFVFPLIIKILNNFNLINFKNKSFIQFNQTLENKLIKNLILIETILKENTNSVLNFVNNIFTKKKTSLLDLAILEKKTLFSKINILLKFKKNESLKNFFILIKLLFIKSFKNIYNEILNYNNEFVINYD